MYEIINKIENWKTNNSQKKIFGKGDIFPKEIF